MSLDPIIERLCREDTVSGEQLCREMGMTRGAVWKRMEKLRAEGYRIASAGKRGYRLEPEANSLLPGYILRELGTRWAGQGDLCYAPVMDSTNTRAKAMAQAGAPHGSLAVCEVQTAGRGRLSRTWETPEGEALMQSLVLRPHLPAERAQLCTLAAAVAAAQAIEDTCPGLAAGIKWPNDVVIGGRKCVGILSELAADIDGVSYVVTGVGINVNQTAFADELAQKATSLLLEARAKDPNAPPVCRRKLLTAYLKHMENAVDALVKDGFDGIRAPYVAHSVTLGQRVRVAGVNETFVGEALDVDDTGALLVRDGDGAVRRVLSGDVSVRGLMGYC